MTDTLTMGVPLGILKPLAADFDGDTLNIFHIINQAFFERCYQIFNPRNAMYISKNDGCLNKDVCPQRDTIININTFIWLGRNKYTEDQKEKIRKVKMRQKEIYGLN